MSSPRLFVALSALVGIGVVFAAWSAAQVAPPKEKAPPARSNEKEPRTADNRAADNRAADPGEIARPRLGLKFSSAKEGLVITEVEKNSAAAQAGLRANDKIVSVDGYEIASPRQFLGYLGGQSGRRMQLTIDRGGDQRIVQLLAPEQGKGAWLGVYLQDQEGEATGAAITHVYPAGPGARAGLRAGDVIRSVNGESVGSPADLIATIDELAPRSRAELTVLRGKEEMKVPVTLGSREQFISQPRDRDFSGDVGREFDEFSHVAPYAMQMEHDRRIAEQHQRMETAILKLQEEVRKLRESVEAKK